MKAVDDLLACALCRAAPWPNDMDAKVVAERAIYHGIAGLLLAHASHLTGWPPDLRARLHAEAVAQTMWEIRHRTVLTPLLAALSAAGVASVILKGTAFAYGIYPAPAQRSRGDTDLLIAASDLDRARAIFTAQGFVCDALMAETAAPERQESWRFTASDGGLHEVDLHVEVFSSPAMIPVLQGASALDRAIPLPSLCPAAHVLPLPLALLHACLHRAQHVVSPYFVGGQVHYGGGRLIWLMDIDLALRAMTPAEHAAFAQAATTCGVGPICAVALQSAVDQLQTPCPPTLITALAAGPIGPAARYLSQTNALGRVAADIRAIPGLKGKLNHTIRRLFPSPHALRARYPGQENSTLPHLYLHRLLGFLRQRKNDQP